MQKPTSNSNAKQYLVIIKLVILFCCVGGQFIALYNFQFVAAIKSINLRIVCGQFCNKFRMIFPHRTHQVPFCCIYYSHNTMQAEAFCIVDFNLLTSKYIHNPAAALNDYCLDQQLHSQLSSAYCFFTYYLYR